MVLIYNAPQTPIEMLSNAFRSPVEFSPQYELTLITGLIVDVNARDITIKGNTIDLSTDDPQIVSMPSDPISVCQFHVVQVSCD